MEKKINPLKIAGILFCVAAVIFLAAFLIIKIYTGGQMKTIDKLYTAVTRGNYEDYSACFAKGSVHNSQSEFDLLRSDYMQQWGEDFHLKADYVSRDDGKKGVEVRVKTTLYNDTDSENNYVTIVLTRQDGKWLIVE